MNGNYLTYSGYLVVALGFVIGHFMIFHGNKINSRGMENRLVAQTKKSEDNLSVKLDRGTNEVKRIIESTHWNAEIEKKRAEIFAEAALAYGRKGQSAKEAETLLFIREITDKNGDANSSAGLSILAAWRYQDIKNFVKASELMLDAGRHYEALGDHSEAALWRREAGKLLSENKLQVIQ